jgi:hypothetical protein
MTKPVKPEDKNKGGRPVSVWTPARIQEVVGLMEAYTESEPIPTMWGFAYKNRLNRTQLYKYPELSDTIKRMEDKAVDQLIRGGLAGKLNPAVTIFTLKNHGLKDSHEVTLENDAETKALTAKLAGLSKKALEKIAFGNDDGQGSTQ